MSEPCDMCGHMAKYRLRPNCMCPLPGGRHWALACKTHIAHVLKLFADHHTPHTGTPESEVVLSAIPKR